MYNFQVAEFDKFIALDARGIVYNIYSYITNAWCCQPLGMMMMMMMMMLVVISVSVSVSVTIHIHIYICSKLAIWGLSQYKDVLAA